MTEPGPTPMTSREAADLTALADRLEKLAKVGFGYDINNGDRASLRKAATAIRALDLSR